jgi:2-C-methyl-D-erythritol 2,4-cyclodiphosphate synthase
MGDKMRAGIGYDAHPLVGGRKLILGGVEIPFARGLSGWSDGDVLTHAIIDALLGAAALGDIGTHFPSGEPKYKDISSLVLLGEVKKKLQKTGWRVGNIDATVVAESPKLRDFIEPMRQKLSKVLGVAASQISIKASTGNGLGFAGRGEGIAAYAIVIIESK